MAAGPCRADSRVVFAECKRAEGKEGQETALEKTNDIHDVMVGPPHSSHSQFVSGGEATRPGRRCGTHVRVHPRARSRGVGGLRALACVHVCTRVPGDKLWLQSVGKDRSRRGTQATW